jgi:hypothetical protein
MKVRHHKKNSFTYCIVDDDNKPVSRRGDNKSEYRDDDNDKPECRPLPSLGGEGSEGGGRLRVGPGAGGAGRLCEGSGYLGG